jgi:putative endonuclease
VARKPKETIGRQAEEAVARHLWWRGYQIVERNYRTRHGEIDLIVRKGDTLAFVEVRSRAETSLVAPKDTVTPAKERRIDAAASAFMKAKRLAGLSVRYDIAEVFTDDRGRPARIDILENAFGEPRTR